MNSISSAFVIRNINIQVFSIDDNLLAALLYKTKAVGILTSNLQAQVLVSFNSQIAAGSNCAALIFRISNSNN